MLILHFAGFLSLYSLGAPEINRNASFDNVMAKAKPQEIKRFITRYSQIISVITVV